MGGASAVNLVESGVCYAQTLTDGSHMIMMERNNPEITDLIPASIIGSVAAE